MLFGTAQFVEKIDFAKHPSVRSLFLSIIWGSAVAGKGEEWHEVILMGFVVGGRAVDLGQTEVPPHLSGNRWLLGLRLVRGYRRELGMGGRILG